ncbi:sulfotransferase family protein [Neotamlana laminarinivorans]|uniref:Sulfotransferase n=1 Tax=Neotamlana laminarinivorans TaxID=2883124 RepID=A0A9X1I1G0_9FLAO|nr:sulfotransferase [Tamlana laminarinivorans]MCB4799690.1 sulfotransferase [Tamlana laminarinivorans]
MRCDFLISSERSGSNLITKIIDAHSQYCGPTPPHLLRIFYPVMSKYGNLQEDANWNRFISDILEMFNLKISIWEVNFNKTELLNITNRSLASVVKYIYNKEAKHHLKTHAFIKEVNTFNLAPYINENFENAKYIWLVRDPRDMALSWFNSPVHRGDLVRAANIWKKNQERTISLFKQFTKNNKIILVKYEALIEDQEQSILNICDFLSINFEAEMLSFHKNNMSVKNAEKTDNWKNLNKAILKNNSKKYKAKLTKDQIQYIEYVCNEEMSFLGYEKDFELLSEKSFSSLHDVLLKQERHEKPAYNLIPTEEKLKREAWYNKYLEIQNV